MQKPFAENCGLRRGSPSVQYALNIMESLFVFCISTSVPDACLDHKRKTVAPIDSDVDTGAVSARHGCSKDKAVRSCTICL